MENRKLTRLNREIKIMDKTENKKDFTISFPDNNVLRWLVSFVCPKGTIYEGEKYTLQFRFPANYVY